MLLSLALKYWVRVYAKGQIHLIFSKTLAIGSLVRYIPNIGVLHFK